MVRIKMKYLKICITFLPALIRAESPLLPTIAFSTSWNSQVSMFAEFSGSAALEVSNDTVYVLNGAGTGNEIVKFSLTGEFMEQYPGWYNWPFDMVLGPNNEVLMSAIGAMGDNHILGFGLVLYNKAGEFHHGFLEAQTGLVRPYGLTLLETRGSLSTVAVADWDNNQTRFLQVDWELGTVFVNPEPVIKIPYPFKIVASKEKLIISTSVCCESYHAPLIKISLFNTVGAFLKEVKVLPTGEQISLPSEVAVDPAGNFLLVDNQLQKTLLFDSELEYLGSLEELGVPRSIYFHRDKVYTLQLVGEGEEMHHEVIVYDYKYMQ